MGQIDINVRDADIEDLRAELAAARAENKMWRDGRNVISGHLIKRLHEQLAAEQATNMRLREEFQSFIDSHEECEDFDGFTAQIVSMDDYHSAAGSLEATTSDASALEAIVKKAGEVMRERCDSQITTMRLDYHRKDYCLYSGNPVEAIRALPTVTLEDLK